ncbi:MAG TPA: hypothetical protein PLM79_18375, partial [Syntrophobacteraceae bacterium]|nr:hypothetical protein [Syntrophobacteraceae bacterium]
KARVAASLFMKALAVNVKRFVHYGSAKDEKHGPRTLRGTAAFIFQQNPMPFVQLERLAFRPYPRFCRMTHSPAIFGDAAGVLGSYDTIID